MKNLVKLFSILQLTKEQPLTGYLLAGIKSNEIATLAEHHYACGMMSWLLGEKIKKAGGQLDREKVTRMLLVHDLSELFGGDIAGPLNKKYDDLREHKDKIGERAIELLTNFLDESPKEEIKKLFNEFEFGDSDEKAVAKIIDQMDHQFFLEHHNYKGRYLAGGSDGTKKDYREEFVFGYVFKLAEKIKDEATKKVMEDFLEEFKNNFYNKGYQAVTFLME